MSTEAKTDYIPIRKGVIADAIQRQHQKWKWIDGRWHAPADIVNDPRYADLKPQEVVD